MRGDVVRVADRRLRATVAIFGVAAVGVAIAGTVIDPAASGRAVAATQAPLLTVRRAPEMLRVAIGRQRLAVALDVVLSGPAFAEARPKSCLVARVDGGTVYADGGDRPVIPASTLKVLTAATALSLIPPGERFVTEARTGATPVNGVINGDLWLVGGGDPLLETPDYSRTQDHSPEIATDVSKLADKIAASGIVRITGGVVGDDRRYDDIRQVKTWKRQYLASGEVGPIGALSINDNFTITNARGRRTGAVDPPRDAAAEFAALLVERGVTVGSDARGAKQSDPTGTIAAPIVVATLESQPIETVVQETLVWSDNTAAEMLLKEVGFRSTGQQGSGASGVAAVKAFAATRSSAAYAAVDGSGLDRGDQVTCSLLVDVLTGEKPGGPLERALPVMGESGTLRRRLRGDAAAGRVRAKTGSLNGVSSLAGFADTAGASRAVFAFVGNGLASTATGVDIGNQVAQQLVRFPDAPPVEALGLQ